MKVLFVGQVGLDKAEYLREVQDLAAKGGRNLQFETVGQKMIQLREDIDERQILNLDRHNLGILRRYAWDQILSAHDKIASNEIFIVNTHSVFRWHHGLIPAIDLDLITRFAPAIVVVLIDDISAVKQGLQQRGTDFPELWELLAWREEEIWFTKFLVDSLCSPLSPKNATSFFLVSKSQGPDLLYRILTEADTTPKVYISFPITGLLPEEEIEVQKFKEAVLQKFIGFDPYSISERSIVTAAKSLSEEIDEAFNSVKKVVAQVSRETTEENLRWSPAYDDWSAFGLTLFTADDIDLPGRQVLSVLDTIDSQIISRDYLLIDQSDFVLMYIRTAEDGGPHISAGCQSEMMYAYSKGKPVYVVCAGGEKKLSPWVTRFSKVFRTLSEAMDFLDNNY